MVRRDFRHIHPQEITVELIEGSDSVLNTFSEPLRESAMKQLDALGVSVVTGTRVVGIEEQVLTVQDRGGNQRKIPVETVLWAAGVRASPLAQALGVPLDPGGRVIVEGSLNIPGYEEAFCVGDMAACTDQRGRPVPGVAPAAMQQGKFVARQIQRRLQGRSVEQFRYLDKGSLATIGRNAAVAEFGRAKLRGRPAWLLWLGVHICFLIGFRNRYIVMVQWIWNYLSNRSGAHLITGLAEGVRWPDQPRRMGRRTARRSVKSEPTTESGLHRRDEEDIPQVSAQ
jgi:NADH dehydrogenase